MRFKKITIAGAGVMGSQIAYQIALNGFEVSVYNHHIDTAKKRLEKLKADYEKDLHLTNEQFQAGMDNIKLITDDLGKAVQDADFVIEALPESLELKEEFFTDLSRLAPEKTIFASNSSSFTPSQLVKFVDRPAKFLHMHFANKIWKYNVAEIMGTSQTDPAVFQEVVEFAKAIKMVPIEIHKEKNGYVLNSILIPVLSSALQLWANGVADPETIDKDWMISTHSPMGPFIILDIIGLRTPLQLEENLYQTTKDPAHKIIIDKLKEMVNKGQTGQEAGQGFYTYPNPAYEHPDFLKK
ncbi:3-hydroxyacyl-CoA dehydrogenase [Lactobacillaceae bacterium 24-114]